MMSYANPGMNMFKVIRMAKRPQGAGAAQFREDWSKAQRAVKPAPARMVVSLSTGEVALGAQAPLFDGMAAPVK